jgi:hypothetical protein
LLLVQWISFGSLRESGETSTLLAFGKPCPTADLFGVGGRQLLGRLGLPEPWVGTTAAAVTLIEDLDEQIHGCERELRRLVLQP